MWQPELIVEIQTKAVLGSFSLLKKCVWRRINEAITLFLC